MTTFITTERPGNEPEEWEPRLPDLGPADRMGARTGSGPNQPHPPGPAGLNLPAPRWIEHPPGPAGLNLPRIGRSIKHPPGPAGLNLPRVRQGIKHPPGPAGL
jgi:hypothetical protein